MGAPRETLPSLWSVLREGWHFLIPFVVLVVGLLRFNLEAEYAALLATAVLIVLALVVPLQGPAPDDRARRSARASRPAAP